MHLFFPKNKDWKNYLLAEMSRDHAFSIGDAHPNLSVVMVDEKINFKNCSVGFSLDFMPNTVTIEDGSISKQSKEIVDQIPMDDTLWVQVFSITEKQGIISHGRSELLYSRLGKDLRKRGVKRGRFNDSNSSVLKVCLFPDRSVRYSLISPQEREKYFSLLSFFSGGFTTIKEDKKAPSRAYRKLVESSLVLQKEITKGNRFLDLGACPGGWSYIALKEGAHVTSVDRSPLREDLMASSLLDFYEGDAFNTPFEGSFDWVVSDIICEPQRILELINTWVETKRCRHFVFTLKFKGDSQYSILSTFKEKIKEVPYSCILRQLNANKNEVMIMGTLKDQESL
jgi:23S rRNA (cytidine2498-2'-O)-methyltransferase